jgi:hypothetical protein
MTQEEFPETPYPIICLRKAGNKERHKSDIRKFSDANGVPMTVATQYLVEFHNLEHVDDLILQIKEKYKKGFTSHQVTQLEILLSLLAYMFNKHV